MGFVLTKGGYKSHWPQVGNLVTWDRAHVTYFSPNSPHSVGGVHPARMCCHFNDSFPQTGASAHMGMPAGHGLRQLSPRKGKCGWAPVMETQLLGPERSLLLSAVCAVGPRTKLVLLMYLVLKPQDEVLEAAPIVNSLLSFFFFLVI